MNIDGKSRLRRLFAWGATIVKRRPYAWYFVWHLVPRMRFLLPHEKDYFGLRHLAGGGGGILLDVGANTGISALGFRAVGIKCDILSIEANRYHEAALRRVKKKISGFDYRILAAGDRSDRITLYTPVYRGLPIHALASGKLEYAQHAVQRDFSARVQRRMKYHQDGVEVIPLDDLGLRPHIIKIDVEGFDDQVLLGLRKTIAAHRPHVLIEYTPDEMGETSEFFKDLNYAFFIYDSNSDMFTPFRDDVAVKRWEDSPLQVNLFCVPAEKAAGLPLLCT